MGTTNLLVPITVCVLGLHLACGGTNPPPASPAANSGQPTSEPIHVKLNANLKEEVATGNTLTEFQKARLLGHYSTMDGTSGFILDRTVTPWRAKLDGVAKYVTLKETNKPNRDETEYASEDRSIWVRLYDSGGVRLFQGPKQHEGVQVTRDADAQQLK